MMKHVYRGVTCFLLFLVSIFIFSRNIKEKEYNIETIKNVSEATFPIMYVKSGDYLVDMMYGYTGNLEASYVKDGMVPLNDEQVCEFYIDESKKTIKKVNYEIIDVQNNEVVEEGTVRKFTKSDSYKTYKIMIEKELAKDKEYAVKNALITSEGTKIYYYARVKKSDTEHMTEIINFAKEFHENTLNKSKSDQIVPYIEPNGTMSSSDLTYVNINSSMKMISFGELEPKVVSDVFINVREASDETAIVELVYYAQAETDSGTETYKICEGYRIRWTATRMYLLYYDRTMESVFDINLLSISANEYKLGITQDTNVEITYNSDISRVCFVRDGTLWYYNVKDNRIAKLYTFKQKETDYRRDAYDENNIKVISVDDNGNVYFMAYGYMNQGDYEGRTAIILYKYYSEHNRIEEMANIPLEVPYDIVKEQLNDFAFVNENEVFFFSIAESIYSYSIPTGTMTKLAQNVSPEDMIISKDGEYIAWQTSENNYSNITIMKLNNYKQTTIDADEGRCIKILGVIGKNIIFGYADRSSIAAKLDGTTIIPINVVNIADVKGDIVKEYAPEGCYVTAASVEGNKITLDRVIKDSSGKFIEAESDCIFSNQTDEAESFGVTSRVTEKTMTDWYMYFPESIQIAELPKEIEINKTVIKGDTTVRVFDSMTDARYYYVFAFHGLEKGYDNAADAIISANERMGVVFDNRGHIIWERGKTKSTGKVSNLTEESSSAEDSVYSCMKMMIQCSGEGVAIEKLKEENGAYTDILNKYLNGAAVDYSKTPLSELVYAVSKKRPVMAMMSGNKAVLIIAYDSASITYYDPVTDKEEVKTLADAESIFATVGNVYIGYVN